jgi:hypothetical protein
MDEMRQQHSFTASRFLRWPRFRKKTAAADLSAVLRKQIERQFLYRGVALIEVKTITLNQPEAAAVVEVMARPLYQDDSRLRYKTWAQLFVEQVFEDAAKVLWTTWTQAPTLECVSVYVYRRPLFSLKTAGAPVLRVRAAGAQRRETVLRWNKTAPLALLQQCELEYALDPRYGLRCLSE